ncbi:MAG TPA: GNAT family N-acetyltransferase [Paracoccaceae bacterium]|nr:GNAT family N-acetyltransferase [Paracoccaceae bacterium]
MTPTFRDATEADLPAVVALLHDDALGAARERPGDPAYARAFAAMRAQPGNRLLLALDDGAVVGCLQLILIPGLAHRGATRAEIESVRTAAARRGEGIGAALVAHALAEARAAGATLAQLTSNEARSDAHRFWRAQGFERTHAGFKARLVPDGGPEAR